MELVGLVSWGERCAVTENPGVYASVVYQNAWITNTVCDSATLSEVRADWCRNTETPTVSPIPPSDAAGMICQREGGTCCSGLMYHLTTTTCQPMLYASKGDKRVGTTLSNADYYASGAMNAPSTTTLIYNEQLFYDPEGSMYIYE